MRTVSLEYRDAHYRMIAGLERGVKRPKVTIGTTKSCSRSVSNDYTQPSPKVRRAGFKDYLQNPKKKVH